MAAINKDKYDHVFTKRAFPELAEYLALSAEVKEKTERLEAIKKLFRDRVKAFPGYQEEGKYAVNSSLTIACNRTNSIDLDEVLRVLQKPVEERLWLPSAVKFTPNNLKVADEHGLLVNGWSEPVIRVLK